MATLDTLSRNTIAAAYGDLYDRLILRDDAVALATITIAFAAGATGVVTYDPASTEYDADGTVDNAILTNSVTGATLSGLTVSTIAAGTGQVQLSSLAAVTGESIDMSAVSITVPASL
jgi:hypothetical protein